MALSEEVRRFLQGLSSEGPWGEEALIETAEQLALQNVDDDSIIEALRAVYADYGDRHGPQADQ